MNLLYVLKVKIFLVFTSRNELLKRLNCFLHSFKLLLSLIDLFSHIVSLSIHTLFAFPVTFSYICQHLADIYVFLFTTVIILLWLRILQRTTKQPLKQRNPFLLTPHPRSYLETVSFSKSGVPQVPCILRAHLQPQLVPLFEDHLKFGLQLFENVNFHVLVVLRIFRVY